MAATFTHAGSSDPASSYSAVINWGDGTTSAGTVVANSGVSGQFLVTASRPAGATTTGTTLGAGGRVVNGVHYYTEASPTPYPVTVTVTDRSSGTSGLGSSVAIVSAAPLSVVVNSVGGLTQGAPFTGPFASFTSSNIFSQPGDFSATLDYGDGSSGPGLVKINPLGGYNVYGTNTYFGSGSFTVTATVTDNSYANFIAGGGTSTAGGGTTSTSAPIVVPPPVDGGGTPTVGTGTGTITAITGLPFTAKVGATFTGQVATLTESDTTVTAAQLSAVIDWGDGITSTGVVTGPGTGGQFVVTGSHPYATTGTGTGGGNADGITQGTFPVNISVTGPAGVTGNVSTTATVDSDFPITAAGTSIVGVQGVAINATVAAFTDPDTTATAGQFSAVINWGDGFTTTGTVTGPGTGGQFSVKGSHIYSSADNAEAVVVTITHSGDATATASTTVNLVQGAIIPQAGTATGQVVVPVSPIIFETTGAALTTVEGQPFSGTITAFLPINQFTSASQWTATLAYPDGSIGSATVQIDPAAANLYIVVPNSPHVFLGVGTQQIGVTVNDATAPGSAYSTAVPISVTAAPLIAQAAPVGGIHRGQTFSGIVATFSDGNPFASAGSFTAIISWGDGHQTQVGPNGILPQAGGGFAVTGTNTYARQGILPLSVTITDTASGATATADGVADITPYTLTAAPASFTIGQRVPFRTLVATFNDPDPLANPANFGALVNWGDGKTQFVGTIQHDPAGGSKYDVLASHNYATAGTYKVTVEVAAVGGPLVTVLGTGKVTPPKQYALTGRLAPDSNTGTNPSLNVTTDRTPRFFGFAGPNSTVRLDIINLATHATIHAGQAVTNAQGFWTITDRTSLGDGRYTVVASATNAQGSLNSRATTLVNSPLVVETSAPTITNAQFDPANNAVIVTFKDAAGFDAAALTNTGAYQVARITANGFAPASVQSVSLSGPATAPVATLHLSGGGRSFFGLQLAINGASIKNLGGIALEGDFSNGFPTSSTPGSLFNGQFLGNSGLITAIPALYQINTAGAASYLAFLRQHSR